MWCSVVTSPDEPVSSELYPDSSINNKFTGTGSWSDSHDQPLNAGIGQLLTGSDYGKSGVIRVTNPSLVFHSFKRPASSSDVYSTFTPGSTFCSQSSADCRYSHRELRHSNSAEELVFDKVPNYYTALSIPVRTIAGCAAHSSSDLITEFIEQRDQDNLPDKSDSGMLDKVPAYQSSFTNSTRYDDMEYSEVVFDDLSEDSVRLDDPKTECRYGASSGNWYNYDSRGLSSGLQPDIGQNFNDSLKKNEDNAKHVSHHLLLYYCYYHYNV